MPTGQAPPRIRGNLPLIRLLDTVGDGTGATDMSLNFVAPTLFKLAPPKGSTYYITEIAITFVATGGVSPSGYGSGAVLVNGLQFVLFVSGQSIIIPQLAAIMSNFELTLATIRVGEIAFQGNDRGFKGILDFTVLGLPPVQLNGDIGDELQLTLEDNYTTRVASGEQAVSVYGSSFSS